MQVELSVNGEAAKSRLLETLVAQGYDAGPGPVRLAYPFTIRVVGVDRDDEDTLLRVAQGVDPGAGRIVAAAPLLDGV